ncbi:MAG: hypothetical protein KBG15_11955 [Kofleriaceae bacterium]|nr:hypothetical protein [Kofleriaceae bacterium]
MSRRVWRVLHRAVDIAIATGVAARQTCRPALPTLEHFPGLQPVWHAKPAGNLHRFATQR